MKSRVIKKNEERVLFYGLSEGEELQLTAILGGLSVEPRKILPAETAQTLGYLAGSAVFPKNDDEPPAVTCPPFLCMSGMSSQRIDLLLAALRDAALVIPLKAVITPVNQRWSFAKLVEELEKEREAFRRAQMEKK